MEAPEESAANSREETSASTRTKATKPQSAPSSQSTIESIPELPEEPAVEQELISRDFDVDSAGVKDRWSRYIGAMGIDAVRRQTTSSVFIAGLRGLGIEIAKNIVLSGVKKLSIQDSDPVQV